MRACKRVLDQILFVIQCRTLLRRQLHRGCVRVFARLSEHRARIARSIYLQSTEVADISS